MWTDRYVLVLDPVAVVYAVYGHYYADLAIGCFTSAWVG